MPKKTLALIVGLVLVTIILFIIALQTGKQQTQVPQNKMTVSPTPDVAHSVLSLSPNPLEVAPGTQGTVDVMIDASDNAVTAVQLELMYDPTTLTAMKITPGPLFKNAVVLINKNDTKTGRFTYAFGIQPNQGTITGTGAVATITFTARGVSGKQSQITVLPTSLVTARGVATSVLKTSSGTTVNINSAARTTQSDVVQQAPLSASTPTN